MAKYETWKQFRSNKSIRPIIKTEPKFRSIKGKGVGQTTILKFLGGNWKQWMIQEALDTIKDKTIDREAVESLPTTAHARKFRKAIKDYKVPKIKQKEIARCTLYPCRSKIAAQDKSSARQKASEGCPVIGTG